MHLLNIANDIAANLYDKSIKELEKIATHLKTSGIHLNVYKNPTPVVVCIVPVYSPDTPNELTFLAVRRNIEPGKGALAFPGGYVDSMESIETAASRELFEETGLVVLSTSFSLVSSAITAQNNLLVFAQCPPVDASLIDWNFNNEEVQGLQKVDANDTLIFPFHQAMLSKLSKGI